ncbi:FAD-dependent thymidylate synthase [Candidatus Woesearchaeota archaeon]|nr:FAD-dependent thymidylate synthase [Candidatus Woesearchaeota archaeon]
MQQINSFQDVHDQEIIDGNPRPGFSGIGPLRGRQDYSATEQIVLDYFFTRTDSNVYAATDNMPNELWAQLMGQFARTSTPARDRALKIINSTAERYGSADVETLATLIEKGRDVEQALEIVKKKASEWVSKWGIDYGHASLRDSGVIRMVFEGISQRFTKEIEAAREGAYQEISTRAVPFTPENLGTPYELRGTGFEQPVQDLDARLIETYQAIYDGLIPHLHKKFQHLREEADEHIATALGKDKEKIEEKDWRVNDKEWEGIIKSKAFDVARYMLPQNITTAVGVTLNARRFQDQLTMWQSHPLWEVRVMGKVAQIESKKISPELMKYGNPSEYYLALQPKLDNLAEETLPEKEIGTDSYRHRNVQSKLVSASPQLENLVLTSILFNGTDGRISMEEILGKVERLDEAQRRHIAVTAMEDMGPHDLYAKIMEIGSLVFERVYDIGAYRDLQRQRGDRQQRNRYGVVGYNMPKEVAAIGLEKVFEARMDEVKELYEAIKANPEFRDAAEYIPVMANVVRHVVTKEPVQMFYEAGLRTQPAGIDSYRSIIQQEMEQTFELMPAFRGLVKVNNDYYDLGRLPEKVNSKIRKAREKTEKMA